MGRKPKNQNETSENINENSDVSEGDNKTTVVKNAILNKEGKKITKKRTLKKAEEGAKIVEKQLAPTSDKEGKYEVLSNLKHNGDFYKAGDVLISKPCRAINDLKEAGIIK